MLALYAEIQVAGLAKEVVTFYCQLEQSTDYHGAPSSEVRYRPLRLTLVGMAAQVDFFTEWAADHYLHRSGWLVIYEGDQVRWRLAFYDAWCVLYDATFQPGRPRRAAYELELELSAAWWEWNGVEIEHHSDLWWEKDRQVRKRVLTPPPPILPGPGARGKLAEADPKAPRVEVPSEGLRATSNAEPIVKRQAPQQVLNPMDPRRMALWQGYLERRGIRFFVGTPEAELKLYDRQAAGMYSSGSGRKAIFLRDPPGTATFFEEAFHALQDLHKHPNRRVLDSGEEVDAWEYDAKQALLRHSEKLSLSYEEHIETEQQLQEVIEGTYGD